MLPADREASTMTDRMALLFALVLVVGAVPPVAAIGPQAAGIAASGAAAAQNGSAVNVTVGQQLSTVVVEADSEVRSGVDEVVFELRFEAANETERAEAIAERAEDIRERAAEIAADYRAARTAYERGNLSASEYAQRIAMLNARAEDLIESVRQLQKRAGGVSALELRVAGFNVSSLRAADERLDAVTGVGARALLHRFTGRRTGEVEIEFREGLSIEVESEDGEVSREIERPRDDDPNITVSQTAALDAARAALGPPQTGEWALRRASIHEDSGYYKFEFSLTGTNETGEAEVRVDGSSGEVFRLETEIEPADRDDQGDEGDEEADDEREEVDHRREITLLIAEGTPRPNTTVTVVARSGEQRVPNATVTLNGEPIGRTDDSGTIKVTLPHGEAEIRVEKNEAEGKLEFEFADEDDAVLHRNFAASGVVDSGTVTLTLTYGGSGVAGATVVVDGEPVGTTARDGTVTFDATLEDELEVEVRKRAFSAELTFNIRDGRLTLVETDFDGGDDGGDDDEEDDEGERDDDEETDDDGDGDDDEEDDSSGSGSDEDDGSSGSGSGEDDDR